MRGNLDFENVTIMNAEHLILHDSFCTNLHLFHISRVIYARNDSRNNDCDGSDCTSYSDGNNNSKGPQICSRQSLYLYNVTIHSFPKNLLVLRLENSHLSGGLPKQPFSKWSSGSNSRYGNLNPTRNSAIQASSLNAMEITSVTLEMKESSVISTVDSTIGNKSDFVIVLHKNASAEFTRTSFTPGKETVILQEDNSVVMLENVSGRVKIMHKGGSEAEETEVSNMAGLSIVTLTAIIVILSMLLFVSIIMNISCSLSKKRSKPKVLIEKSEKKNGNNDDDDEVIYGKKYVIVTQETQ